MATRLMQATAAIVAYRAVATSTTVVGAGSRSLIRCTQASASTNRFAGIYAGPDDAVTDQDIEVIIHGECFAIAGGTIGVGNLLTSDSNGKLVDVSTVRILAAQRIVGVALAAASTDAAFRMFVQPSGYAPGDATDTAANLALLAATINTTNKYAGKAVWVSDAARMVWSAGTTAAAVWKDGSNATVYTPV